MSWSVQANGSAAAVKREVQRTFDSYGPSQSKDEFAAAKAHIDGLLDEFAGDNYIVRLSASGSGRFEGGKKVDGTVQVRIEPLYISK